MNRRFFWQIPECVKYRLVFEDAEIVVGVNEENRHCLFRKDTGKICFSEGEALKSFVEKFLEKEFAEKPEAVCI